MTGRNAFQETDVIGIATPVTKYTLQPLSAAEVPFAVKQAFYIATTGRPGPVLLDLPKDVQQEEAEMTFPDSVSVRAYRSNVPVDPQDVERAAAMIVKAERPILWGGGGVRIADAAQPFAAIAELLMAPVITTLQGKGDFPEDHPLSLGPIGMHGRAEANKLVSECDLLVAVGVRFSDRSTGNFAEFAPGAKIIHIDADPTEFNKNKVVDLSILGDANQVLAMLFDAVARRLAKSKDPSNNPWLKRVNEVREELKGIPAYKDSYAELSGPKIVKRMREILPPEAILTTGVGRHQMWCEIHYKVLRPRTWITSTGLGTMGFGLPAADRREVREAGRARRGLRRRRQLRHDRAGPRDGRRREAPDNRRDHQRQEPGDGRAVAEAHVQQALHRHKVPEHPRLCEARGGLRRPRQDGGVARRVRQGHARGARDRRPDGHRGPSLARGGRLPVPAPRARESRTPSTAPRRRWPSFDQVVEGPLGAGREQARDALPRGPPRAGSCASTSRGSRWA